MAATTTVRVTSPPPELSVVVPVYNEVAGVEAVLASWIDTLDGLGIDYELLAYDDASSDGSEEVLAALARSRPRVRLTRQERNRGHGPTVLEGYRAARGDWVFQVDSDGELTPAEFPAFWERRREHDFVLGVRVGRSSPLARRLLSSLARLVVAALFGGGVRDVNCPYRLMRRSCLVALLPLCECDSFAPNVILSGLAVTTGLRVAQVPVAHRCRSSGESALGGGRWARGGWIALLQTVRAARRARRR